MLFLPLLSGHRLVADGVARTHLHLLDEQPEVLAQAHQRSMLVVHLHPQRAIGLLAELGDRVERVLLELGLRDEPSPAARPIQSASRSG